MAWWEDLGRQGIDLGKSGLDPAASLRDQQGGKKTPPPSPDYVGAAEATAAGSERVNTAQTWANRPNMETPGGSQSWTPTSTIDPSTGKPVTSWASKISLNPSQQAAFDSQQSIQQGRSAAAARMLPGAVDALGTPMDWNALPEAGQVGNDFRQQAQDAITERNAPMQARRQGQLETQLANMGLTRGSEAWNTEMGSMRDQFARDDLGAISAGQSEADLGLRTADAQTRQRQAAITDATLQRTQPLNEMNALMNGQNVGAPSMPAFTSANQAKPADMMGAAGMQGGAMNDRYNAQQAQQTGMYSGLASMGMMAAYMWSDKRLKTDLVKIGTLRNGIEVWSYRYIWGGARRVGVLAQQVCRVLPSAVRRHWSGYLAVDYGAVLEAI